MDEQRDERIAAEYAAGREVDDICGRWGVTPAYVERVVEDATVARPKPKIGLRSRGNRIVLAVAVGLAFFWLTHSSALFVLFAVTTLVVTTLLIRRGRS